MPSARGNKSCEDSHILRHYRPVYFEEMAEENDDADQQYCDLEEKFQYTNNPQHEKAFKHKMSSKHTVRTDSSKPMHTEIPHALKGQPKQGYMAVDEGDMNIAGGVQKLPPGAFYRPHFPFTRPLTPNAHSAPMQCSYYYNYKLPNQPLASGFHLSLSLFHAWVISYSELQDSHIRKY